MRLLARTLAVPALAFALALVLLVTTASGTDAGLAYAVGLTLVALGVAVGARHGRAVATTGLVLVAVTAITRVVVIGVTERSTSRWVNRLVDEQDLAVNGARALRWTAFRGDPDVAAVPEAMRRAYQRMRLAEGSVASPVAATYLGLERRGASDTIELGDVSRSAGVLVFLHGYGGSFTLPCWVVARAAADAGFATVCPATRPVGDWWSPEGEGIVRDTLRRLETSGVRRIVLAGLSNGGVGASLIAPHLRGRLAGVIVISGASSDAAPPGVPVLALQGELDAQIPASVVRAYAHGAGALYVPLDAGHFALLMREKTASDAIAAFLRRT
jgi:hypothetical protein